MYVKLESFNGFWLSAYKISTVPGQTPKRFRWGTELEWGWFLGGGISKLTAQNGFPKEVAKKPCPTIKLF